MEWNIKGHQKQLERLERQGERILDVALGSALDNFQQERIAIEKTRVAGKMVDAVRDVTIEQLRAQRQNQLPTVIQNAHTVIISND